MRRGILPSLALAAATALSGCGGGTAPSASTPSASAPPASTPPSVGSPLCDDLRATVRPGASQGDAERAAARVLEQVAGGSAGVLPADVEAGLRERAEGGPPNRQRTAAVERFVQEQCG